MNELNQIDTIYLEGPKGKLEIDPKDKIAKKFAMLFEITCFGKSPQKVAEKYGYTRQRYYQLMEAYRMNGVEGIIGKKPGPKQI